MNPTNLQLRFALVLFAVVVSVVLPAVDAFGAVAAKEDFDGGAMNLVSGFNPATDNLDGGAGDFFGVGNRGAWPQGYPPGMPFGLADDSVVSVSNPANQPFPTDSEAVFGQARSMDDDFFGISDTREWTPPPTASWTFNIASFSDLKLSIDMGSMANEALNGYTTDTLIEFKYQIDGGPVLTAFSVAPDPATAGYGYRLMDSTLLQFSGVNGALRATGTSPITKTLIDTGAVADNQVLDKTPPDGTGAGLMDTYSTMLTGTGNQLTLMLSAHLPFEAMAFDNIVIEGTAGPGGVIGDYNGNGTVDAADYVLWRNGGPLQNEGDTPGVVNDADYAVWRANFGDTTPGSGAALGVASVPEPMSAVLIVIAIASLAFCRRVQ